MDLPLVLAVAISMVFLYLLGSQVVLSLYELWAGYTNSRGKFLYRRLKGALGSNTTQQFYQQPAVAKLTPAGQAPPCAQSGLKARLEVDYQSPWNWWLGFDGLPAYIPADLFAATVLGMVAPNATGPTGILEVLATAGAQQATAAQASENAQAAAARAAAARQEATAAQAAADDAQRQAEAAAQQSADAVRKATTAQDRANQSPEAAQQAAEAHAAAAAQAAGEQVQAAARAQAAAQLAAAAQAAAEAAAQAAAESASPLWYSTEAATLLSSLLAGLDATSKLEDCQKTVARWFDAYGERMTGWYKRQVRVWLFLIGLAVAVVSNIDSLFIARYLWQHPQLSERLAEAGGQEAATASRPAQGGINYSFTRPLAGGKAPAAPPAEGPAGPKKPAATCDSLPVVTARADSLLRVVQLTKAQVAALNKRLRGLGFPIGRADTVSRDSTSAELPAVFYVKQPARTIHKGGLLEAVPEYYTRYTRKPFTDTVKVKGSVPGIKTTFVRWEKVNLPLGTAENLGTDRSSPRAWYAPFFGPQPQPWWHTLGGWLLTAAALAVGAPFWFDLLCRLVNIRNLGIKPPRTAPA